MISKILLVGIISFVLFAAVRASDPKLEEDDNLDYNECRETDHWALELAPGTNPQEIADKHGHDLITKFEPIPGIYIFKKKPDTIHGLTHPHHNETKEIHWCQNQLARRQSKRVFQLPTDPNYKDQWHLHRTDTLNLHTDIEGAWEQTQGQGVTIAIVDDGLEHNHEDLHNNYNVDASYDFNYGDSDPYPDTSGDAHGTSAAGCAAAVNNTICGVGTAYGAKVSGIRLISRASSDFQEASALNYRWDLNHIYSNSWGPYDDGKRLEGPQRLATAALEIGARDGRGGKGSLFVWAGGNGRASGDNCNYDGWANSRYTISVGAIDSKGQQSWYSESCAMLLISAPSSGADRAIFTTDLLGYRGSNGGDCNRNFGGTSAAAPMVAGIVALVIAKNPELTWRDVQGVLLSTATKINPTDTAWSTNGGGFAFSHKFGFGMVNASAAVALAGQWQNLPAQVTKVSDMTDGRNIPEFGSNPATLESTISVTEDFVVEHAKIHVVLKHGRRGDLNIQLVSPFGTSSVLMEKHGDNAYDMDWTFGSVAIWGERSQGTWKLLITDQQNRNSGHLVSWSLELYGH